MRSESLATRHVLIMAGNYYVVFQLSNKTPPPPRNTHSPTPSHNFGPTASSFQYAQPLACIHLVNKPFGWRSLALGPLQYFSIKGTTWLSNILWVCSREKPESWKIAPYIISITLPVNWTPLCQSLHLFFFSFFFFFFLQMTIKTHMVDSNTIPIVNTSLFIFWKASIRLSLCITHKVCGTTEFPLCPFITILEEVL